MKYLRNLENESDAIKKTYDVLYYIKPLGSMKIITTTRYTAVDLGLPSGLKWANMNVGAEKETDYGKYFQWGDVVGYADASHSTADTCPGGGSDSLTAWDAENLLDGILKPKVDAATVNMGSKWRMPTYEDCRELIGNTDLTSVEIDGVKGGKFTSKIDSSKYIFLPFAGYAAEGSFEAQGTADLIWSSSVYSVYPQYSYAVGAEGPGSLDGNIPRYYALSVRGVC